MLQALRSRRSEQRLADKAAIREQSVAEVPFGVSGDGHPKFLWKSEELPVQP
jgi:hypothetical protein